MTGLPYSVNLNNSRASVVSMSLDSRWRRRQRQAFKRGIVRRVKLTKGHFIAEYPVPTAVKNAIEPQYASNRTTEFSYVVIIPSVYSLISFFSIDT